MRIQTALLLFMSLGCALAQKPLPQSPLTPEQALAAFQVDQGLQVDLVAAEPVVGDPVAVAFDDKGRMFVAENRGYPTGLGEGKPPAGIIALLEDVDGDGRFEKRTVFADGLTFPNGVLPWNGGVIVTCAPDVLFLADTNGDGRADVKRVLLTGFNASNTTQLRVSHPTWGPDNWVYVTSGLTGGKIRVSDQPESAALETRTDIRFKPETLQFEVLDGKAQFGQCFDDFGHRFICMNRVHIQHLVLPSRYLARNPHLTFAETVQNVPESMTPEPLKGHGAAARIYPISHNITTADSHAGTFTAACGVMIYRGNALPEQYYGNAFACDPAGNLVHRDTLRLSGATFSARAAQEGREFLASPDDWFRPVFLANGPDGALYICDMYRKTIEHPQYLPEEIRKRTDFDSGRNMGRIWRVRKAGRPSVSATRDAGGASVLASRPKLNLAAASTTNLCAELANPNAWWRETAQRMLVQRQDKSAIPLLKAAIRQPVSPMHFFHALQLLDTFSELDNSDLRIALVSANPFVREQAIQLTESRLADVPALAAALLQMAADPDPHVRFQCALALGNLPPTKTVSALAAIGLSDAQDRWTRAAVLSSVSGGESALFDKVIELTGGRCSDQTAQFVTDCARLLVPALNTDRLAYAGSKIAELDFSFQAAALEGIAEGLRARQRSLRDILDQSTASRVGAEAAAQLTNKEASVRIQILSAALLGNLQFTNASSSLSSLLKPGKHAPLQTAAAKALMQMADLDAVRNLVRPQTWNTLTPSLKETILASFMAQPKLLPVLFDEIESGELPPGILDSTRRKQLRDHRDPSIRERASRLFEKTQASDRMKVYESYKTVLQLKPDPKNGKAVFAQHCAACHRLDREGTPVGPDLFGIRNQPKEAILLHILVPEYEIQPGFAAYEIETKDGRSLSGIIAAESPSSVTLRRAQGEEENVPRDSILSITATGLSLMPQELEKNMSRQDLSDLLAYLKGE